MYDTSKMLFPMFAISNVSLPDAQYVPGDVFDAKTEKMVNKLLNLSAARPYRLGEHAVSSELTKVVKTEEAQGVLEALTLTPRQLMERYAAAKGTNNVKPRVRRGSAGNKRLDPYHE